MYSVEFSKVSEKQFYNLEKNIQVRIISSLERIRIRPHAHVKKLVGSPYYSLRVGDYRIILDVKDGKLIIFIIEIGHRKNVYKS